MVKEFKCVDWVRWTLTVKLNWVNVLNGLDAFDWWVGGFSENKTNSANLMLGLSLTELSWTEFGK